MSVQRLYSAPHLTWAGGKEFRLLAPYAVVWYDEEGAERHELCAPKGMRTDLASIPRVLRVLVTGLDDTIPAAVIHDAIYRGHTGAGLSRSQADRVFLEVMQVSGVRWVKRFALWAGVRAGGWASWQRETGAA